MLESLSEGAGLLEETLALEGLLQDDLELFSVFASNVAFAFERAQLTENIYKMFEGFVAASVSAIVRGSPAMPPAI